MERKPLESFVRELLVRVGFPDADVSVDADGRRGAILLDGLDLDPRGLQETVDALNHIASRYAERVRETSVFFDINGYRKEREELIGRLAEAAAGKARTSGTPVELPGMNSYERRIVHGLVGEMEGVVSGSAGLGRERRVTIRRAEA